MRRWFCRFSSHSSTLVALKILSNADSVSVKICNCLVLWAARFKCILSIVVRTDWFYISSGFLVIILEHIKRISLGDSSKYSMMSVIFGM